MSNIITPTRHPFSLVIEGNMVGVISGPIDQLVIAVKNTCKVFAEKAATADQRDPATYLEVGAELAEEFTDWVTGPGAGTEWVGFSFLLGIQIEYSPVETD